ncbi:MAG: hypothetical protein ABEJ36_03470 [Candidatus Nanosalina sp.]
MSQEKEEIVSDPGNHALLKYIAGEGRENIEEVVEETGLSESRIRQKTRILQERGLLSRDHGSEGLEIAFTQQNREKLEELREEIYSFAEAHSDRFGEKLEDEKESLEDLRDDLKKRKRETEVMKKEKKLEKNIEAVNSVLKGLKDTGNSRRNLAKFSKAHRLQRNIGERKEFQEFNPSRKIKALERLNEVLAQEPEEEESRRFFGNRWISTRKL